MLPDKKALKILFDIYMPSPSNFKAGITPSPADHDYARSKGYVFDPVKLTHDQTAQRLLRARSSVILRQVTDAFVASLSTRRLELRSALGSFAFAANFPDHTLALSPSTQAPSSNIMCHVCGVYEEGSSGLLDPEDLSRSNFERFKWGGVNHLDPLYAAFDLEQFGQAECPHPTPEDYRILNELLKTARGMPHDSKPGDLCKAISKLLPSNDNERRILVQILAICGVLAPHGRPGFLVEFATAAHVNRDRPHDHKNDWSYPANWWRGADKVSEKMVAVCFPGLSTTTK
jgi:hypothetical protein